MTGVCCPHSLAVGTGNQGNRRRATSCWVLTGGGGEGDFFSSTNYSILSGYNRCVLPALSGSEHRQPGEQQDKETTCWVLTGGGGEGDFFPYINYSILSGKTGVCCPHSLAVGTANRGTARRRDNLLSADGRGRRRGLFSSTNYSILSGYNRCVLPAQPGGEHCQPGEWQDQETTCWVLTGGGGDGQTGTYFLYKLFNTLWYNRGVLPAQPGGKHRQDEEQHPPPSSSTRRGNTKYSAIRYLKISRRPYQILLFQSTESWNNPVFCFITLFENQDLLGGLYMYLFSGLRILINYSKICKKFESKSFLIKNRYIFAQCVF